MTRHQTLFLTLSALLLAFTSSTIKAAPLDEEQARLAAARFFSPSSSDSRLLTRGQQLTLRSQGHEDGYYIFDRPEGGCVFVADDDAIGYTILGFTDAGSFDVEELPTGLRDWLDQVTVLMSAVHEGKIKQQPQHVTRAQRIIVEPLIRTTWDQWEPYNGMCPMVNGKNCLTGCVATAMAQVMNYWRWPIHGYGSVSYYDGGSGQTLSQKLSSNVYDWSNMLSSYSNGYNTTQATAVAMLMRDCGFAVNMSYGTGGSYASISASTMQTFFHYSVAARDRYSESYSTEQWNQFIQRDLDEYRPVLYSGQGSQGGHEFILDGYDADNYYHVNWGWSGNQDGWFILTNLNGYNNKQSMINHLMPDYSQDGFFTYELSADSVLTIHGSGMMPKDYSMKTAPWREECDAIRKIVISDGITSITDMFGYSYSSEKNYYFSNLREVSLPEGLLLIGESAFSSSPLEDIKIPSTIVKMDYAFSGCCNLKSLHIPANVEEYKGQLNNVGQLTVATDNPWLTAKDNILYSKDGKTLLLIPEGLERVVVSETTEHIVADNLMNCGIPILAKCMKAPSLPNYIIEASTEYAVSKSGYLFIPCGATGFNTWQFYLPSGWTVLNYFDNKYVPDLKINWEMSADSILTISGWSSMKYEDYSYYKAPYFEQQGKVRKLIIGEGINSICVDAFWSYNNLTEIELPSTLRQIEAYGFGYSPITTITSLAFNAPALAEHVFEGLPKVGTLRVPQGSKYGSWIKALPTGWTVEYIDAAPFVTAWLHTGNQQRVSDINEWNKLLKQFPNAVGIVNQKMSEWAYLAYNLLIEDTVAGTYYCPFLQLSDLTSLKNYLSEAPRTGFYAPVTFTAIKGKYNRTLTSGYNSVCLPFALSDNQLPTKARMYSYSHYSPDRGDVVFTPQSLTVAGSPCFIICESGTNWQVNLADAVVNGQPSAANAHTQGTFVTTDAYQGIGYSPRTKDNIFAPLAQNLHPFRACILVSSNHAPAEIRIRLSDDTDTTNITEDQNATGISDISVDDDIMLIYSLSGQRITSPPQGQPYIIRHATTRGQVKNSIIVTR